MAEDVELINEDGLAVVRLSRPTHRNAIRGQTFDELRKIALRLADRPPKAVLLVGAGDHFSGGLDLDRDEALFGVFAPIVRSRDAFRAQEVVQRMQMSFKGFSRLPCPVVAAIEGQCHGAGLELAVCADLRVAARSATFAMHEPRYGIVTGFGGMVRLTTLLGATRTHQLLLTDCEWSAEEADRIGLITEVCEDGAAELRARELLQELGRINPTARLQTLLAVRSIQHQWTDQLLEHERQAAARTWIAGDWQEGVEAATRGEEPDWNG
jgi:enoyl-CoA hydratase/carnithine racemase